MAVAEPTLPANPMVRRKENIKNLNVAHTARTPKTQTDHVSALIALQQYVRRKIRDHRCPAGGQRYDSTCRIHA